MKKKQSSVQDDADSGETYTFLGNVSKYAMENTRVYVDVKVDPPNVQLSLKNISAQPLNISADELTERFIRGDVSRNTEGSGLGLSIAKVSGNSSRVESSDCISMGICLR